MFGNPLYIWAFPEYTVARATEEMSAEYATVMQNVAPVSYTHLDVYKRQA